ncbi:MAG: M48 family metallopeptidase [Planctomycetota bacterium]|nr:M48 family metallopeptidase [Planctomycetota bacterium]
MKSNFNRRAWMSGAARMGIAGCLLGGCKSAPMTGRKQLLLLPESQEIAMGQQEFGQILQEEPISQDQRLSAMVHRVGTRLAAVAGKPNYQWDFRLLQSETPNAFCLPGGKVAVYDGILPVCQTEAGLAVVMSHEISHAIARHGGERMSQKMGVNAVQTALDYTFSGTSGATQGLVRSAYGAASQYGVILPYSRKHESEADLMGIQLMARAGYDPSEAPRFWSRFGQIAASSSQKPPEWLSTHPSDQRRSTDLAAALPNADMIYQTTPARYGMGEAIL